MAAVAVALSAVAAAMAGTPLYRLDTTPPAAAGGGPLSVGNPGGANLVAFGDAVAGTAGDGNSGGGGGGGSVVVDAGDMTAAGKGGTGGNGG